MYIEQNFNCDIITFVPMHEINQKQRGYNQCELLADRLGELLNISVSKNNLIKHKQTDENNVVSTYLTLNDNLHLNFLVLTI